MSFFKLGNTIPEMSLTSVHCLPANHGCLDFEREIPVFTSSIFWQTQQISLQFYLFSIFTTRNTVPIKETKKITNLDNSKKIVQRVIIKQTKCLINFTDLFFDCPFQIFWLFLVLKYGVFASFRYKVDEKYFVVTGSRSSHRK